MKLEKVLFATDFSEGSRRALDHAVRIAARDDAELVIVHAWQLPVFAGEHRMAPYLLQQVVDHAQHQLTETSHVAAELGARKISTRLVPGPPVDAIVEVLTEDPHIDLAVLGTHGRTGLGRVLLGSVAERLVRQAPCSVLAVHPTDRSRELARVLCPTDFADDDEPGLQLAAHLAPESAAIELVHVVDIPRAAAYGPELASVARDLEQHSDIELARRIARVPAPHPVRGRTEVGHTGERLLALLDDGRFDLAIVGPGKGGPLRAVIGSMAEKLVRHASCPVLVARRRVVVH